MQAYKLSLECLAVMMRIDKEEKIDLFAKIVDKLTSKSKLTEAAALLLQILKYIKRKSYKKNN